MFSTKSKSSQAQAQSTVDPPAADHPPALEACGRYFIRIHTPQPNALDFKALWKALNSDTNPQSFLYKNVQLILVGKNRKADFIEYAYNNDKHTPDTVEAILMEIFLPTSCDPTEMHNCELIQYAKEQVMSIMTPTPCRVLVTTVHKLDYFQTPMTADDIKCSSTS